MAVMKSKTRGTTFPDVPDEIVDHILDFVFLQNLYTDLPLPPSSTSLSHWHSYWRYRCDTFSNLLRWLVLPILQVNHYLRLRGLTFLGRRGRYPPVWIRPAKGSHLHFRDWNGPWYERPSCLSTRRFPATTFWTRLILVVRIPWTNPPGEIEELTRFLNGLPRLTSLFLKVDLRRSGLTQTGPQPVTRAQAWLGVLHKLHQLPLKDFQFDIHVSKQGQHFDMVEITRLSDYATLPSTASFVHRSTAIRVRSCRGQSAKCTLQDFGRHLMEIYSLYGEGWRGLRAGSCLTHLGDSQRDS